MTSLRVVLLLVGALIITGLIIWEKRKRRSPNTFRSAIVVDDEPDTGTIPVAERIEPHLSSPALAESELVAETVKAPPVESRAETAATTVTDEVEQTQGWEQLDLEQEAVRLAQQQSNHADKAQPEQVAEIEPLAESVTEPVPEQHEAPAQRPAAETAAVDILPIPEELVILYITAPKDRDIQGAEIQQAMKEAGLQLGDMNLFHYPVLSAESEMRNLFSVADIREPGHFDAARLGNMSTPGLAVFMQLPGPLNGLEAFDKMLNVAQQLSDALYCTLQDERKNDLGRTEIENIKEQILKFNLKLHS